MNKLLFLTGNADSPFIRNEIGILKDFFDDICLISYTASEECFEEILKKNGVRGYIIPKWNFTYRTIKNYIKWLSLKHVKSEIRKYTNLSIKGVKSFFYICYYGMYVVNSYKFLENELINKTDDCNIYLYAFWLSRPSYMAAYLKKLYQKKITKVIARGHGYDLYEERTSIKYLPFRQFISANMDEIHFISNNGKSYYKDKICVKYGITDPPKLYLNYLGTYNTSGIKKVIRDKTEVVIVSCASIVPVKRLDLIIDFLSSIKGISMRWIHIGGGKMLDDIKQLANDKIPHIEARFYGNVDNEAILTIYSREDVDFLINMSDSEGLPVSIMEAMSAGIPVIARNVGGISEIVDNENGCLLEGTGIKEKDIVRQFILMRIENVCKYRKFSENAVRTWKDNYSAEVNYRKFCEEIVNGIN